jgi:hypothetical protein
LEEISQNILDWIWDGFDASLITFGKSGTGKTFSLFGTGHSSQGIVYTIMNSLYKRLEQTYNDISSFKIGISCWDIWKNDVVDLLSKNEKEQFLQSPNHPAVIVDIHSMKDFLMVGHYHSISY